MKKVKLKIVCSLKHYCTIVFQLLRNFRMHLFHKYDVVGRISCLRQVHRWGGFDNNICLVCGKKAVGLPKFNNPPKCPRSKKELTPINIDMQALSEYSNIPINEIFNEWIKFVTRFDFILDHHLSSVLEFEQNFVFHFLECRNLHFSLQLKDFLFPHSCEDKPP